MEALGCYIALASAIAALTFTIAITSVFEWLSELVSKIHPKVEEFIHCPWCMSFWCILLSLLAFNIETINISPYKLVDFVVTLFAIYSGVGLIHYVLLRAYKPVTDLTMMRQARKLKHK